MKRGIPHVVTYSFSLPEGQFLECPDAELWTFDEDEAREYAKEHGYQLIETTWSADGDSDEVVEDFRPFNWHAEESGVIEGGDVGGDYQAGDAWSFQLVSDRVPDALMRVYVFAEALQQGHTETPSGEFRVSVMTACDIYASRATDTDPEWSDINYDYGAVGRIYYDSGAADSAAHDLALQYSVSPEPFTWDGERF